METNDQEATHAWESEAWRHGQTESGSEPATVIKHGRVRCGHVDRLNLNQSRTSNCDSCMGQ